MKTNKTITVITRENLAQITYSQSFAHKGYTFFIHRPLIQNTPLGTQSTENWTVTEGLTGRTVIGTFPTRIEAREAAIERINKNIADVPALVSMHKLEGNPNDC